jgi:hypothetical protein
VACVAAAGHDLEEITAWNQCQDFANAFAEKIVKQM